MHKKILIVEPNVGARSALTEAFIAYDTRVVAGAQDAIAVANEDQFSAVLLELSLKGHSGMEFLYEFRSYTDWANIPVVVYTSVQLESEILKSDTWKALNTQYVYKPESSLAQLTNLVKSLTHPLNQPTTHQLASDVPSPHSRSNGYVHSDESSADTHLERAGSDSENGSGPEDLIE